MIHYISNAYYIVVRSEFKNVKFRKMLVNFYMLHVSLTGFVIVIKQLILFLIQYGSRLCP